MGQAMRMPTPPRQSRGQDNPPRCSVNQRGRSGRAWPRKGTQHGAWRTPARGPRCWAADQGPGTCVCTRWGCSRALAWARCSTSPPRAVKPSAGRCPAVPTAVRTARRTRRTLCWWGLRGPTQGSERCTGWAAQVGRGLHLAAAGGAAGVKSRLAPALSLSPPPPPLLLRRARGMWSVAVARVMSALAPPGAQRPSRSALSQGQGQEQGQGRRQDIVP